MNKKRYKEAFERASDERKKQVLEIATQEFSSKGYENANINIIAKKVGISVGLLYKYFATKEDLFITCLQRGMAVLDKVLNEILISDDKLLIKAEKLIRATCSLSKQNENYIKLYNEITNEKGTELVKTLAQEIEKRKSKIYITAIAQALAKGDVRPDLNPRYFAFFLDNLLTTLQFSYTCDYYKERLQIYTGVDIDSVDDEEVVKQLLKFIESAFTFQKD